MATTADFKNVMCLDIDGQYYFIVEFLHLKPGKGRLSYAPNSKTCAPAVLSTKHGTPA